MTMFDPTDAFPQDDEEHGFDNIGKTLVMSDFLVEKYLDAADQIVERRRIARPPTRSKNSRVYLSHHARRRWVLAPASRRLKQGYDELFRRPDDRWGYMSIDRFRKVCRIRGCIAFAFAHPHTTSNTPMTKPCEQMKMNPYAWALSPRRALWRLEAKQHIRCTDGRI